MIANLRADSSLPTGTVTFLFTDIEGSTKLWEAHPAAMRVTLARHDALMRKAIVDANGYIFKTVGDAFCAAFAVASDSIMAVLAAQLAIVAEPWLAATPIKVRMALHTGAAEDRDGDYFGQALNRVARLLPTGHGGQALVSQTTYDLIRDALPDAVTLRDLGAHRLRDLARPEQVYQLLHPGLRRDFAPIKSLSTHPNNLPQQLTSFIGREKEIVDIEGLLTKARLLTLAGAGGSGKTRLTLQVAADVLEQFPDGAWFVELAPLLDPGLVPQAVATLLGVKEEAGEPLTQALVGHLADKRLLLVLDNCEHLLYACAQLADALVRRCPGARILASSREALGVAGEQIYRVPSLTLPDRKAVQTPAALSTYESVRLFIDRALLVRADFAVTNRNAPAIASVCWQLDGIPLAIELAAARVRTLSIEEIDGKLNHRFRLLTGGSRTALPRHQTLRALIDWSYDLLNALEQRLLQRLSVFAGGWTLSAAEAVGVGNGVAARDILDLLTSLADKSLVAADQNAGSSRFGMLETVRQYAREKLAGDGGEENVRERHLDHFLGLAEDAQEHLRGADQATWLRDLEAEHENLRAALGWSVAQARPGGLGLCAALPRFWTIRGHWAEGREWCARVLRIEGGTGQTPDRAKVLDVAGQMAYFQCDYPAALARHSESLATWRQLGDKRGIARAMGYLGNVSMEQGEFASARSWHEESLAIARELGDPVSIAWSLGNLGSIAVEQGDPSVARSFLEESLAIRRELGDRGGMAFATGTLGTLAFGQHDYSAARLLHEQSLEIGRELGDRVGIATSLGNLGNVAFEEGNEVLARALHREGLAIRREVGDRGGLAYSLEGLAHAATSLGNSLRAARIWGAAEQLRSAVGAPLSPTERIHYDPHVAAARAANGDDGTFDRAWQEGRALTLEQAIALALEES